ncbi:MAG: biotin--[acetyl-CoA-carboxylase] ligase [Corynebacterium sp.]|nr:biotin--[acetyl-CoA-carboxylase] ligase [Corynebacterium sp.]
MTDRMPIDVPRVRAALRGEYAEVHHTQATGSTNADLVSAAHNGAPAWTAHITEYQHAGRGRHGRVWTAPQGSQVTLSILIRPPAQTLQRLGTMPLITGLAILDALPIPAKLKWPNDVLINGRKVCGILGEAVSLGDEPALVLGLGLNVSLTEEELPVPHAISLDLARPGVDFDRTQLTIDVLLGLRRRLTQWMHNNSTLMTDYRAVCSSIGQEVKVLLPGDETLLGTAVDAADDGKLVVVDTHGQRHELAAGDVTHLRLQ